MFFRTTGSPADVKEIQYISALHQTVQKLRKDGSVTASDVSHFLLSRYGIKVTEREVEHTIIKGFGGTGSNEIEECIDIAELIAILLIPFLVRAASDHVKPHEHSSFHDGGYGHDEMDERDSGVISHVVKMILHDATGSTRPVLIDRNLMEKILTTYGEQELAQDSELVDEMVLAATGGAEGVLLDKNSFETAITGDVTKYDLNSELALTTNFFDVFGDIKKDNERTASFPSADEETSNLSEEEQQYLPKHLFTASSIDTTASTNRSTLSWVLLMAFFLMTQFTYFPDPRQTSSNVQECTSNGVTAFPCIVRNRILVWINIALTYTIGGTLFISVGSLGNNLMFYSMLPRKCSLFPAMISIVAMTACTAIPPYKRATDNEEGDPARYFLRFITFCLGTLVVLLQIFYLTKHSSQNKPTSRFYCLKKLFLSLHSGSVISESKGKQAAAHKTELMVKNAIKIHGSIDKIESTREKTYSLAMLNYERLGHSQERCGGICWTWKQIISGEILSREGLWIPSEIITGNCLQFFMTGFIVAYEVIYTREFALRLDSGNLPLGPAEVSIAKDDLHNLVPAVKIAGYAGAAVSLCACLAITLAYIPSTVRTMIEFRCGKIPSLNDRQFFKYIVAPHSVSKVTGSMIWAVYYAGVAAYFLYAAVVFIFYYEGTRNWAISHLANIIGFLIPITVKFLVLLLLTKLFYAGLYRVAPAKANFMALVLQCLDFGLAFGYMLIRSIKMTVVLVFYFGRVDTPFFAPGIASAGAIEVDDSPTIYRRLLVSREAHRHPYLETIGKMYLLKLRHGEAFGRTSGSRWRLIFVSALMPWVRNHRIMLCHMLSHGNSGKSAKRRIRRTSRARDGWQSRQKRGLGYGKAEPPLYEEENSIHNIAGSATFDTESFSGDSETGSEIEMLRAISHLGASGTQSGMNKTEGTTSNNIATDAISYTDILLGGGTELAEEGGTIAQQDARVADSTSARQTNDMMYQVHLY